MTETPNLGNNARTEKGAARMELAFRESESNYRRLFEAARDGILILEVGTGRITDVNPFLFELLGFSRAEMIGKTVGELSPFRDIEANSIMLGRLQKNGFIRYEDLPLETKDGRKIDVEFVSNVYEAGDKKVIQCNVRDITERKAREKQMARLAAIIECSSDAIVSTTANGIVIGWNRGAEQLYGYSAEEMIGHPVSGLFLPDAYKDYMSAIANVRNGETVRSFDTIRRRKDGVLINVSIGFTPIEARDGEIVGVSKISHDISRIKKLEAQLVEAQKMEVLGQLAGGIAHDFDNILGLIMGYANLITPGLSPECEEREYLVEIQHAAARGAGLTRQLVVFSRRQTVQLVVLDLNDVVNEVEKMLRRLVDEDVQITISLGEKLGRVKADSGYIGQLTMNLVVNARDAMPDGGRLTIATTNVTLNEGDPRLWAEASPGDYVSLSCRDTGTGMTDEVKAHLFEAFFTTKPKGKGTGLGLATCHTIVQQAGGHISVESKVGCGTTFNIYFPRIAQPPDIAVKPPPTGPLPRGTETLLLVEDEPAVRDLACLVLEAQGYHVLRADNGRAGLSVARESADPIALVITDVVMPEMSGKIMVDWLQSRSPHLKVLFTSGYTEEIILGDMATQQNIAFLPKPYNTSTLVRRVRDLLDARAQETLPSTRT